MSSATGNAGVTLAGLRNRRAEILEIARRHGGSNVRVFGSVARGEAGKWSDLDFLVDMEQGRSLLDMGGLLMDLAELIGCEVDVVTENGIRERVREHVLSEARAL